jgi:hypothetical protein
MFSIFSARFGSRAALLVILLAAIVPSIALADLSEEKKLTATGGASVAISDDGYVAVVGDVTGNAGAGAAYIYTRALDTTTWTPAATLTDVSGLAGDQFGASVSISGDRTSANIAIGAPGASSGAGRIHVFTGTDVLWTENPGNFSSPLTSAGNLGASVSIQGFRVVAGAPHATVSGKANTGVAVAWDSTDGGVSFPPPVTFRPNGGQARSGALFGTSVSLSGNTVLVGAPHFTTGQLNSGTVFIFANNGGTYSQVAKLRPANTKNNFAGTSVSLFSDSAAFGAPGNSNNKGAVYIYTRTAGVWSTSPTASITDPGNTANDAFGSSVSQLGTFVVAGAPGANSGNGAAYEFGTSGGPYSLLNQLVPSDFGSLTGAQFGFGTGVNAGRAIAGAPGDGSAYIFKFLQPSTLTITCFSSDPNSCVPQEPSLTGQAYTVFVHVVGDGITTPTGTVNVDDSAGGTCTINSLDSNGDGHCTLTSTFFGMLTMSANYLGDLNFSPVTGTKDHTITGDHLVFNPTQPADVLQGNRFAGTVEVRNGVGALITSYDGLPVTLTISDTCGNTETIGPVNVALGVATFAGIGDRFYTITSDGVSAHLDTSNGGVILNPPPPPADTPNANVHVVVNPDFIFADGFEDCRL